MTRIRVVGDKAVIAGLAKSAAAMQSPGEALGDAGAAVARNARKFAAKRTGRMASRVRVRVTPPTAQVSNSTRYAPFQEHGTRYMNAHPFMRPAGTLTPIAEYFDRYAEKVLRRNL